MKSMDFNQRGEKYGQIIHVGIGGWYRWERAQIIDREIC